MIDQLSQLHIQVESDPKNVSPDVKKEFWRIVSRIKRTPNPSEEIVSKASEIRDLLYLARLGRSFPTKIIIPLWCLLGLFGPGYLYYWTFSQTINIWIVLLRLFSVTGIVFFFYPPGRLIAGTLMGIRFDGVARDLYWEPTMKINYPSYLRAPASKRKWFFFLAGLVTPLTALFSGIIGYSITQDYIGFLIAGILGFYAILAMTGIAKVGEMAHYYRERRIERDWNQAKINHLNK